MHCRIGAGGDCTAYDLGAILRNECGRILFGVCTDGCMPLPYRLILPSKYPHPPAYPGDKRCAHVHVSLDACVHASMYASIQGCFCAGACMCESACVFVCVHVYACVHMCLYDLVSEW